MLTACEFVFVDKGILILISPSVTSWKMAPWAKLGLTINFLRSVGVITTSFNFRPWISWNNVTTMVGIHFDGGRYIGCYYVNHCSLWVTQWNVLSLCRPRPFELAHRPWLSLISLSILTERFSTGLHCVSNIILWSTHDGLPGYMHIETERAAYR